MNQPASEQDCVKVPLEDEIDHQVFVVSGCEEKYAEPSYGKIKILGYPFFKIKWFNVFWVLITHSLALVGYVYAIILGIKMLTLAWAVIIGIGTGIATVAGSHRLWAHRSYKARWPLRLFFMVLQTSSVNGSIYSWARDHRTHHKYSDTKYDPKNPSRGFFYSHLGWWFLKKDNCVLEAGRKLDFQDLLDDPLVRFQHRYFSPLVFLFWFLIPAAVPYFGWHEDPINCVLICVMMRSVVSLHHYFTVNSLAHLIGQRTYDTDIRPCESRWVNYFSLGEGHHNYHHIFPWDYCSSQRGWIYAFNPGTLTIEIARLLGLAYDLKKPSKELIERRVIRTGLPDQIKLNSTIKMAIAGVFDWFIGILIAAWPILLGLAFRLIYLASTNQLQLDKVFQF